VQRVVKNIESTLRECDYDALLAFGPDNFAYLSQTPLPFAEHYPDRHAAILLPRGGAPTVIAPVDWAEAVATQAWQGDLRVYDEDAADAVVPALVRAIEHAGLAGSCIAVDTQRVSRHLMQALSKALASVRWVGADGLLEQLRIIKTDGEIACIETACKQADRAMVYALMHLEGTVDTVGYTVAEFSERIRVHVNENGGSGVGLLATMSAGDARLYYAPQRGQFHDGALFRMDVSSHHTGYWCNLGRMGVTGEPSREQSAAYTLNRRLKQRALERLRPGVSCSDVYAHVVAEARRMDAPLCSEVGIGHGVGTSHHEPPYLTPSCATELAPGMVIALDIYTRGPADALIHDKDVYAITEDGQRLLSWYRDWDRLYAVTGFRATH
jgi:Xaa-Pro dipeptidase